MPSLVGDRSRAYKQISFIKNKKLQRRPPRDTNISQLSLAPHFAFCCLKFILISHFLLCTALQRDLFLTKFRLRLAHSLHCKFCKSYPRQVTALYEENKVQSSLLYNFLSTILSTNSVNCKMLLRNLKSYS